MLGSQSSILYVTNTVSTHLDKLRCTLSVNLIALILKYAKLVMKLRILISLTTTIYIYARVASEKEKFFRKNFACSRKRQKISLFRKILLQSVLRINAKIKKKMEIMQIKQKLCKVYRIFQGKSNAKFL